MECAQCGAVIIGSQKNCASCGAALRQDDPIPADEIDRLLAEANLMRIRKHLDEAVAISTRVLRLDPSNATAHSLMGDIYRDEGNHREALGWYKLAVQLDPENPVDRKKLDAMIDRVFEGANKRKSGQANGVSAVEEIGDVSPVVLEKPVRLGALVSLRRVLAKITPTHVIVSSFVLAFLVIMIILISDSGPRSQAQAPKPSNTNALPAPNEPDVPEIVPVTRPNSDGSIPGLGIKVVPKDQPDAATPSGQNPAAGSNTPNNSEEAVTKVPPFPLNGKHNMTGAQVKKLSDGLNSTLLASLKSAKLSDIILRSIELDPRSMVLTIEYEIPPMKSAVETKQALLYAAFYLVWEAQTAESNLRAFTVSGYAHPADAPKEPLSRALLADIVPQQANEAREAGSYKEVIKYLSNSWWRDDLVDTDL